MNNYINNTCFLIAILLCSCGEKKTKKTESAYLNQSSIVQIILNQDSGKRSEFYIDTLTNKKEGTAKIYKNEVLRETGNWVNNKQEGLWSFFDSTGKLSQEVNFRNDRQTGTAVFYDSKGIIIEKSNWFDDKLHGESFEYYKDGSFKRKTEWVNGKKVGVE